MPKSRLFYPLVVLGALSPALANLNNYFLADDWPVLRRLPGLSWDEVGRSFTSVRLGWYRPLFEVFLALCRALFGLNPLGYHLAILFAYALTALLVGAVAELLTASRRTGLLAAGLFAVLACHAEPLFWIAAANEVLAGLCVLSSLAAYLAYRRAGRTPWLALALACYVLGLAAKESAAFLPLALVAYDLAVARPTARAGLRRAAPWLPFFTIGAAHLLFRLQTGSPYPLAVGPARILANLAYYAAVEVFALPDNYAYLSALPLWRLDPWYPLLMAGLTTAALGILVWALWRVRRGTRTGGAQRALVFALAWSALALLPVLLTATGRTAFASSVGIAWSVAIAYSLVAQHLPAARPRRLAGLALALFVVANLIVLSDRAYWWRRAGDVSRAVLSQVAAVLPDSAPPTGVWLVGLPDHLRHAYAFRNAFPDAGALVLGDSRVRALLDSEASASTPEQAIAAAEALPGYDGGPVYLYSGGKLVRARGPSTHTTRIRE